MTFFKRKDIGRVYVIRIELPGDTVVHKIGMTHSDRSVDRMMEILRSWFTQYRFVPYVELRLDMQSNCPIDLERHMHKMLHHKQFLPDKKVDGGTEMFVELNEVRVLHYIRTFNENLVPRLDLTDEQYRILGDWLSP